MNLEFFFFLLFLNLFLFFNLDKIAKKFDFYDIPDNERKLHCVKVPNVGGFFFFINLLVFLIFIMILAILIILILIIRNKQFVNKLM
jgi:UDP-N-acetylmuramyl pentapeptide phosphotransferase/UDP-N-acetylglucosamine-1-phosphate transferase